MKETELRERVRSMFEFIALYKGDRDWKNNVEYALQEVMRFFTEFRTQEVERAKQEGIELALDDVGGENIVVRAWASKRRQKFGQYGESDAS